MMDEMSSREGYKLILHSQALRSASASGEPYVWWHPSANHQGNHPQGDEWWENPCWLNDDFEEQILELEDDLGELSDYAYSALLGEMDAVISDARFGQLREVDRRDHWLPGYGVERCRIVPGVAEIKFQKPFYIRDQKVLGRIYYSEPDDPEVLLSLGFQVKRVDAPDWKQRQDDAMKLAQSRGDDWVTSRGLESTDSSPAG